MCDTPPYMNLSEFRDLGLLQEVNRLFFHPLGLALSVTVAEDGSVCGLAGILDGRDDPEGIYYDPTMLATADAHRKAATVAMMKALKTDYRASMFAGDTVQGLPPLDTWPADH